MSRVLLVNPPSPFLLSETVFPPLGLLTLGAALERAGHEVSLWDMAVSLDLDADDPDLIGITAVTSQVPLLEGILRECRNVFPGVPVTVGGPHFTVRPRDGQILGADYVCVGDGERAILDILSHPPRTRYVPPVPSCEWPTPARHLLAPGAYRYGIAGRRATSILTSRGCPFACAYCTKIERGYRMRPLGDVRAEVVGLRDGGYEGVMLYDEETNVSRSRFVDLCALLKDLGMRWRGFVRSDLFTVEQAALAAGSGCYELCTGVESGSDEILRTIRKGATTMQAATARVLCRDHGIRLKTFFIIGLPGESESTALMTRDWLLRNAPDDFDLAVFTPYPGSDIGDHPERYDIRIERSYWDEPMWHKGIPGKYRAAVSTSHLSAERIVELRDEIDREVRRELCL